MSSKKHFARLSSRNIHYASDASTKLVSLFFVSFSLNFNNVHVDWRTSSFKANFTPPDARDVASSQRWETVGYRDNSLLARCRICCWLKIACRSLCLSLNQVWSCSACHIIYSSRRPHTRRCRHSVRLSSHRCSRRVTNDLRPFFHYDYRRLPV